MPELRATVSRVRVVALRVLKRPLTLWVAFVLVHLWLGLVNLYGAGLPLGDVTLVYKFWMDQGFSFNQWVGIDTVWVYPIVALIPMLISRVFGSALMGPTWLTMVMLLNAVAFGFLTGWGRSRARVAIGWWWVAFLFLLGPIALGRIDSVSVPLALIGVILIARRPRVAAAVLTVATWIKVWPAAIILSALLALRTRWRIAGIAGVVSLAIVGVAVALGAGSNVFSFVTAQTGRALQIEAPVSTIWVWLTMARVGGAFVYYDREILTYEVTGPGADVAIAIMSPLLAIAVVLIAGLGLRAKLLGGSTALVFAPLTLALTTSLIAFNKVGSPQYIAWLAVPIVLGLITAAKGGGRSFRTPATVGLVIALLTQIVYPYWYHFLLHVNPFLVVVLTARNILEFVLLGWAVLAIVDAPRASRAFDARGAAHTESVWPFRGKGEGVLATAKSRVTSTPTATATATATANSAE